MHSYLPAGSPQSGHRSNDSGSSGLNGDDDCSFPRAITMKHIPFTAPQLEDSVSVSASAAADFEKRITFEDFFPAPRQENSSPGEDASIDDADSEREQHIDAIVMEKNQRLGSSVGSAQYMCNDMYVCMYVCMYVWKYYLWNLLPK